MQLTTGLFDLIVIGVALEGALLAAMLVRLQARPLIAPLVFFLLSGVALMIALRTAIADGSSVTIQAMMLLSLLAHLAALGLFWRAYRSR